MKSLSDRDVLAVGILLTRSQQSSKHQYKAAAFFLNFTMIRYRKNACTKAKFERKRRSPFKFHLKRTQLVLK